MEIKTISENITVVCTNGPARCITVFRPGQYPSLICEFDHYLDRIGKWTQRKQITPEEGESLKVLASFLPQNGTLI